MVNATPPVERPHKLGWIWLGLWLAMMPFAALIFWLPQRIFFKKMLPECNLWFSLEVIGIIQSPY